MVIRKSNINDFEAISIIFEKAKSYMRKNGNMLQWADGYPYPEIIKKDIETGVCHVCVEENEIIGVFSLLKGPDPTYSVIIGNGWLNNNEYGVIHRIAVGENRRGVAGQCIKYAQQFYDDIRIDTHRDNLPMRRFLAKHGFLECGIIFLENGEERIAFHKENARTE